MSLENLFLMVHYFAHNYGPSTYLPKRCGLAAGGFPTMSQKCSSGTANGLL